MLLLLIFYLSMTLSDGRSNSESLDLRKLGLVTNVKNQESCQAGWAFGIVGLIEGQYAKQKGQLVDFSAQELVDCLSNCGDCKNCDVKTALDSLIDLGGVLLDEDYPFVGKPRCCNYKPVISKARVTDYTVHKIRCENDIMRLLKDYGPVYVAIDGDGLEGYKNGVLQQCPHKKTNHAVLLIGYGTENGVDYWLIKNSWGTTWGMKGYGKIRRGINACGLMYGGVITAKVVPN